MFGNDKQAYEEFCRRQDEAEEYRFTRDKWPQEVSEEELHDDVERALGTEPSRGEK